LYGVQPGPVVNVVAFFDIDGLLDGADMNAAQAAEGEREVAIGAWIILRPEREAQPEVAVETSAIAVIGSAGEHQTREGPLALLLPIFGQLEGAIFDATQLIERFLEGVQRAQEGQSASYSANDLPATHLFHLLPENITARASSSALCPNPSSAC
jgi:hypothetical protein